MSNWDHLPQEMRDRAQWLVCSLNPTDPEYKVPTSVNAVGGRYRASVTSPSQWLTFAQAVHAAKFYGGGIGYVLNESDPYTCIDLDVKDAQTHPDNPQVWTTPEDFERYTSMVTTFDSYTEKSASGKGLHIWIRADTGRGFKRGGVEVYSRERFIICTGAIVLNKPIQERAMLATNMVARMRPIADRFTLVEIDPEVDDWYILEMAAAAQNRDKFIKLFTGDWQNDFTSQSEADLALMSMFTFYSESNSQVRRLFRDSALGKREKAVVNDKYINTTLTTIRGRQHRESAANVSGVIAAADAMLEIRKQAAVAIQQRQGGYAAQSADAATLTPLHSPLTPVSQPQAAPLAIAMQQASPVSQGIALAGAKGLPWPPGAVGALAQFIYQASVRPLKEVSIVAAIGVAAGIVGKAWNIPQSGLNMYITLVAQSGVGKEAMHSGPALFMTHLCKDNPMFNRFIDFDEYASGPALMKAFPDRGSFVNISGEWGRRMKRMAINDDRDGPLTTLRTTMTNLYQKSGHGSVAGGLVYSNKDSNIKLKGSVAFSFIGETTPDTFYESLTSSMMEDGFLSRFLIIGYEGPRPDENMNQIMEPNPGLVDHFRQMCIVAMRTEAEGRATMVAVTQEASDHLRIFNKECDVKINSTQDESVRQMWNRAALKAQRLAAVLAVATNYAMPCVQMTELDWAIQVVRQDIAVMSRRLEEGDVGISDGSRERKLFAIMKEFITEPQTDSKMESLRVNMIVPRLHLHKRVQRAIAFSSYRGGTNAALDHTLRSMVDNGLIMQVEKSALDSMYGVKSTAYRVLTSHI